MDLIEQILSSCDCKRDTVQVPEWGNCTLTIRQLSMVERMGYLSEAFDADGKFIKAGGKSRLLVYALGNEAGDRIFTNDHIAALDAKNPLVIERLYKLADDLNFPVDAVDDAEKKSPTTASSDSSSS